MSRRVLLGQAAAAAVVAGVGMTRIPLGSAATAGATPQRPPDVIPFYGEHQAGIRTSMQRHLVLAAFDVSTTGLRELQSLFSTWTAAAALLTEGMALPSPRASFDEGRGEHGVPETGDAEGLGAARLTLTLGLGPSLFDDRFGLQARRPAALADLPTFAGEALESARCGGDLVVQACADDPQVAFHAIRTLAHVAAEAVHVRWAQSGFVSPSADDTNAPRNLLGFKDGTHNLSLRDEAAFTRFVWVGADTDQPWMRGGSYLVARRVRLRLDGWDSDSVESQERTIGRRKHNGAQLSPLPVDAHIRLASHTAHGGARILRRGYSYAGGVTPDGKVDAGLQFLAYQRDPRTQFVPLQRSLARHDALNAYAVHVGSALFAVPPGVQMGTAWAHQLTG